MTAYNMNRGCDLMFVIQQCYEFSWGFNKQEEEVLKRWTKLPNTATSTYNVHTIFKIRWYFGLIKYIKNIYISCIGECEP